tara:strand:+ start:1302 stop:3788 length:2487 start_codon:yes stop_codon:yes gene_type:complete
MPTAGKNADIVVSNSDGSTNQVALTLWRDDPSRPGGWEDGAVPTTPVPQAQGDSNYSSMSPEFGRVYSQSDWTAGFGMAQVEDHTKNKSYGYTDGVLSMFEHELVLGYREDQVGAIIRNGNFETGGVHGWTDGTNTAIASSTSARSGSFALSVTAEANGGTCTHNYLGTDTVLSSRQLTAVAYVKRSSGTGTISFSVTDGVGSTTSSTSSSSDWTLLEVTRTIHASPTAVKFTFTLSADDDVFLIDDVGVILTGGSEWEARPVKFGDSVYSTMGRSIMVWSEEHDSWLPVYVDSAYEITGLASFENKLYAGRGSNNNYLTSTNGTTWSNPTTNSGNNRLASFFAVVKNARGDWALMKTRANQISISVDPTDTLNWGAEIQAGDPARNITSLTSAAGTAYIGREDGLFVYNEHTNLFSDVEPDANFFASAKNFKSAIGRGGALWASGGEQTFWTASPTGVGAHHDWENLSHLVQSNAYSGFGGHVSALAQDRANVWVALSDNSISESGQFDYIFPFPFVSSGVSDRVRLISIRNMSASGDSNVLGAEKKVNVAVHTITSFTVSQIDQLSRYDDGNLSSMFALGSFIDTDITATDKDVPRCTRIRMPRDNENPRRANNINVRLTGTYYTPWIDFNYPDTEKAEGLLTLTSKNFASGSKYVTVSYKTDDATDDDSTGWTAWGDDGVFDTSPSETKSAVLTTPVTFKRIRFKLEFTTNSHVDDPPTVTAMVFKAVWNETEPRKFRGSVKLTDRRSAQLRRVPQRTLRAADITTLDLLRKQPFVQLVTPEGESVNATFRYRSRTIGSRIDATRGRPVDQVRAIDLEFTEVLTS